MRKIEYFDYEGLALKEHVPAKVLERIEKEVKSEFPDDKMMYELHVLRAVMTGYWKDLRKQQGQTLKAESICIVVF